MKAISLLQPLPWVDQSGLIVGVINTFQLSVQKLKLPKIINTSSEGIKLLAFYHSLAIGAKRRDSFTGGYIGAIYEMLTFP